MHLTINMRIQDDEQKQFVDYLLRIGEGKELVHSNIGEDMVKLPSEMIINDESVDSLISEVFGDINEKYKSADNFVNYIKNRVILTSKNEIFKHSNTKWNTSLPFGLKSWCTHYTFKKH